MHNLLLLLFLVTQISPSFQDLGPKRHFPPKLSYLQKCTSALPKFPQLLKDSKKHSFHHPGAYLSSGLAQSLGLQVHLFALGLSLLGGGGAAFLFLIIIHSRHRPRRCLCCFLLGGRSFGRKLPTGLLQHRHDLVFGGRLEEAKLLLKLTQPWLLLFYTSMGLYRVLLYIPLL